MIRKLFFNARIFTPTSQGNVTVYHKGYIMVENGRIVSVGEMDNRQRLLLDDLHEIDLGGATVIPGFVDPHTHSCFGATREAEFIMRLEGKEYLDILKAGGGIHSSVRSVESLSDDDLFTISSIRVNQMLVNGTTTIEIKSGYGLNTELELKMLRVIERLGREMPIDVVPTFMGAHAVPLEYSGNTEEYVDLVINDMLKAVKIQGIAKFFDVFCEKGVFSVEQSRKMLNAAAISGLKLKVHADEVHSCGGASLAADVGALSAEHLLAASDEGITAMAKAGTIAVLLPTTALSLKKPFARARKMLDSGVKVALATDCNPGTSFCQSMPFVFMLGILGMNMTPDETLMACTLNAARAIGKERDVGSIEPGKKADFITI
ncbi:MAG: imidazolonepropionase, partial [Synergistaceae bacterium]|nr:imidazolonepropionase [Synergistaceae bacterium]